MAMDCNNNDNPWGPGGRYHQQLPWANQGVAGMQYGWPPKSKQKNPMKTQSILITLIIAYCLALVSNAGAQHADLPKRLLDVLSSAYSLYYRAFFDRDSIRWSYQIERHPNNVAILELRGDSVAVLLRHFGNPGITTGENINIGSESIWFQLRYTLNKRSVEIGRDELTYHFRISPAQTGELWIRRRNKR
jgi:hypothetical protein